MKFFILSTCIQNSLSHPRVFFSSDEAYEVMLEEQQEVFDVMNRFRHTEIDMHIGSRKAYFNADGEDGFYAHWAISEFEVNHYTGKIEQIFTEAEKARNEEIAKEYDEMEEMMDSLEFAKDKFSKYASDFIASKEEDSCGCCECEDEDEEDDGMIDLCGLLGEVFRELRGIVSDDHRTH